MKDMRSASGKGSTRWHQRRRADGIRFCNASHEGAFILCKAFRLFVVGVIDAHSGSCLTSRRYDSYVSTLGKLNSATGTLSAPASPIAGKLDLELGGCSQRREWQ